VGKAVAALGSPQMAGSVVPGRRQSRRHESQREGCSILGLLNRLHAGRVTELDSSAVVVVDGLEVD